LTIFLKNNPIADTSRFNQSYLYGLCKQGNSNCTIDIEFSL
jgi:hypothetical protein